MGFSRQDLYSSSKHTVLGLIRATFGGSEFKNSNFKLALVAPWLVATPLTNNVENDTQEPVASAMDVAQAVTIIATSSKEEIHGKSVVVRGRMYKEMEGKLSQIHYQTMLDS